MVRARRGQIPLWVVLILAGVVVAGLGWWTWRSARPVAEDGRTPIVFWGSGALGEEIYTIIQQFEQRNPQYKVIMSSAVARTFTEDAQRLITSIAGGVPPDLVWFDRFAIGEWCGRGALEDLTPFLEAQDPDDPYRIDLQEYYDWAIAEASYAPPGTDQRPGVFGIPASADIRLLYSNGDLLRQEGLVDEHGEPRPPRTWEELRAYAQRLTRYHVPGVRSSGIARLGFAPNYGNSWLYMYAWMAGGELINEARTRITMDSPPVVRALKFIVEIYDELGGIAQVNAFQAAAQGGELDPFLKNLVGMKIDTDWGLHVIADWRPNMDFIISPAPMPADQLALGRRPVAWSGGFAYIIPTTAQNKQGAFKLIQYIASWEATQLLEQGKREQKESEGRLYLPQGMPNRVYYERLVKEFIHEDPRVPPRFKQAYAVIEEMFPHTLIRPVTPVGQLLWNQHVRATDAAVNHALREEAARAGMDEELYALTVMQRDVQQILDEILEPPPPHVVNWTPYFVLYGLVCAAPFGLMVVQYRRRRREYGWRAREVGAAMLFASPWIVGMIVFVGGPIVFSVIFSFTRYDVLSPARYVGVENYAAVLRDPVFYQSLYNTAYMILRIPLVMAVSLAIALMLNRAIRGIGFYRTAFYMPAIMPLVASSLLWWWLFNPSYGALNQFLAWLFALPPAQWIESFISLFTAEPFRFTLPLWLNDRHWSKPSLILMNLWTAGGGMIIWLAGLQAIPQQLYEAASIDGANAWKRFRHVTIPMLSPYILFNLIIGLIGTMQIFAEAFIMTAGGPADSTLFYAYYLFRQAFQYFRMGYASALAWILFVIVLILTLTQLWLSKKWVHYDQV